MRPHFKENLARTLRRIQRKRQERLEEHTASSAAASTGSLLTNTFQESGYRFNYFHPKHAAAYFEAQSDISHWLKDVTNESIRVDTSSELPQAAPKQAPIAPPSESVDYVVQSGLTTPEGVTFSFDPPSSQQLWTPLQQEHAARIYLQRELATEDALANPDSPVEFDSTPCPLTPANPDFPSEFDLSPSSCAPASAELPSKFDVSPPLHAQPPSPVILKGHQRANLERRFQARVDSPTASEDTYQRLLKGYSVSTSTSKSPVELYSVNPASLVRPSAPEPASFDHYDDQEAEIDRLRKENANLKRDLQAYDGLKRQLQIYKDMADSLIQQSVERTFSERDDPQLNRRIERLQRRLDEDDGIITQQKIHISLVTDERDSLKSSLQNAHHVIKTMSEDINHQADRIEDLEGDLQEAHGELYRLTTRD